MVIQDIIRYNLEDHEKTTFPCPFGVFAYRRMSFGSCNAPKTFQHCMQVIIFDLIENDLKFSWTNSLYLDPHLFISKELRHHTEVVPRN